MHFCADSAFAHACQKLFDDFEVDIGFKQRDTHLAHGFVHVFLRQKTTLSEAVKNGLKFVSECVEHSEKASNSITSDGDSPPSRTS